MDLKDYSFEEISKGMKFEFSKVISKEDVEKFIEITFDSNPLHTDDGYAIEKGFKSKVVHGMLVGSLFSTLVGMICPGKRNLYLSQDLKFIKPVYSSRELTVLGEIIDKVESLKILTIKTLILEENKVLVEGIARVKII